MAGRFGTEVVQLLGFGRASEADRVTVPRPALPRRSLDISDRQPGCAEAPVVVRLVPTCLRGNYVDEPVALEQSVARPILRRDHRPYDWHRSMLYDRDHSKRVAQQE